MLKEITEVIYYLTLGVAALLALIRFKRADKAMRLLRIYIIYGFVSEMLSLLSILYWNNNYVLSNLYDYGALLLLLAFFYHSRMSFSCGWLFYGISGLGLALLLFNLIFVPQFRLAHQFNAEYVAAFLQINLALYTIYRILRFDENSTVYFHPLLKISTLIVLYQLSNILIRTWQAPQLAADPETLQRAYLIVLLVNIIYYAGLTGLIFKTTQLIYKPDANV